MKYIEYVHGGEENGKVALPPHFRSRRSDWPYRGSVLDWEVSASVVLVQDIPHVLFCADHSESELKKEVRFVK